MKKTTTIALFAVIAIGAIKGAPAHALFRKKNSTRHSRHATYDTPRTLQLKSRIAATSDQTEQLERKKDKIETQLKANKSSLKSWAQEIKSIYKAQEDEAARIQAEKEQAEYQVGRLDFHYHESDTSAKLADDDEERAKAMADYGGYNDDFKTIIPTQNDYLISEKEHKVRTERQGGIRYYPATRN